jgi:hypothetical protein
MCCPRVLARFRPSAVRVRIRSRSPSARPHRTAIINRPVLVSVSARNSARDQNCPPASTMRLIYRQRRIISIFWKVFSGNREALARPAVVEAQSA